MGLGLDYSGDVRTGGCMAKTIEQLREDALAEEKKLREEYKTRIKQLKERERRAKAAIVAQERKEARKRDAHAKILIGAYVLGQRDKKLLTKIMDSYERPADKDVLKAVIAGLGEA